MNNDERARLNLEVLRVIRDAGQFSLPERGDIVELAAGHYNANDVIVAIGELATHGVLTGMWDRESTGKKWIYAITEFGLGYLKRLEESVGETAKEAETVEKSRVARVLYAKTLSIWQNALQASGLALTENDTLGWATDERQAWFHASTLALVEDGILRVRNVDNGDEPEYDLLPSVLWGRNR